ncbi:hypothetical protein EDC04DRAFT_2616152 [Pisolithus marmoratus]|nr:hypothetical protein EDC04DRAFT_2616152 [Pisolithus marmoratus]
MKVFDLDAKLARHNYTILREAQQGQLQCVINCGETQCIAWDDTTNMVSICDRPPLEPDVQQALEGLHGLQVRDPAMKKPMENIDMLEVIYHTAGDAGLKLNSQKCKWRHSILQSPSLAVLPMLCISSSIVTAHQEEDPSVVDLNIVSGPSTIHQSADNWFEILADADADAPSGNPDAGDDPMVDQDKSKYINLDADTSMEAASSKGNNSMHHVANTSMEKAGDKECGGSDESSNPDASQSSHRAPPQFKQKLNGASSSSKLVNVAEADEDVSNQLG